MRCKKCYSNGPGKNIAGKPRERERALDVYKRQLIKLQYRHQVTEEEVAYLALHIKRIRTK